MKKNLIDLLLHYARKTELSDSELAQKIGVSPALLNRWKHGHIPDLRKSDNLEAILRASSLLKISFQRALAFTLFGFVFDESEFELSNLPSEPRSATKISPLSSDLQKKLYLIGLNSVGCEEILDVVLNLMKTYKSVKGGAWTER